jgi:glyoxylase-like metal-dependent hydrolase (beta-lactamase superfamily II)
VLIDPVKGQVPGYLQLLRELELELVVTLDTHVHADHVTALGDLREATGCRTQMGEPARASCVSASFKDGDTISFGDHLLTAVATPSQRTSPAVDRRNTRREASSVLLVW